MQVESLAGVVVVVGFFFPNTAGFWVWFLPPSLPPSDSFSFASPCLQLHVTRFLGEPARVTPPQQGGRASGPSPAATSWGGSSPPRPPVKGFGGESEHGKHVGLALKGTEPGALGVGSQEHPHRRQGTVQLLACGARPLPPPLLPRPPRLSLFNNLECIGGKKSF